MDSPERRGSGVRSDKVSHKNPPVRIRKSRISHIRFIRLFLHFPAILRHPYLPFPGGTLQLRHSPEGRTPLRHGETFYNTRENPVASMPQRRVPRKRFKAEACHPPSKHNHGPGFSREDSPPRSIRQIPCNGLECQSGIVHAAVPTSGNGIRFTPHGFPSRDQI